MKKPAQITQKQVILYNFVLFAVFSLSAALCSYNRNSLIHMFHVSNCWDNARKVMDSMLWKYMPAAPHNPPWDMTGHIIRYDFAHANGNSGCPDNGEYHVDFSNPYYPGFDSGRKGHRVVAYHIGSCSVHGAFKVQPDFSYEVSNPYESIKLSERLESMAYFWLILATVTGGIIILFNLWSLYNR